jgi:hypothetical protein
VSLRASGGRLAVVALGLTAALWWLDQIAAFPDARRAVRWGPTAHRAIAAAPAIDVARRVPILSLVVADADLHDPARGLLANALEHGAEWERPGTVAYFEDGRVRFAGDVGVRIHGGGSRETSARQGFRLYFRKRYGAMQLPPGVLFEADAQPLRHLVVHNDVRVDGDGDRWHLANPVAYDIAAAMGALTPDTRPVRFYLNGELQGMYVLTERFDEAFFAARLGHQHVRADQADFDELWQWVSATRPVRMADVAERVDLDNLTRWFLSVAFCVTRDPYQGPGQFLDPTRERAGWFWVNWDMDRSFRVWDADSYNFLLEQVGGPPRGRNLSEPRPALLTRLLTDDPAYREFFAMTFDRVMNHHVTGAFLSARLAHYRGIATALDPEDTAFLDRLALFLDRRPAFFRLLTEQWLDTRPSQPVRITTPATTSVTIDGEVVAGTFAGRYFPDRDIALSVRSGRGRFTEWRVNGEPAGRSPDILVRLAGPTDVEAVFEHARPSPLAVPPPLLPESDISWPATPLVWVRVPAGRFLAGCVPDDPDCDGTELPQHAARIDRPFDMLATEVTVGQFAAFAAAAGGRMPRQPSWAITADHPVVNVTWDEATGFCAARRARLPTELEWEYAARGGAVARLFPWEGGFAGQANLQDVDRGDQVPLTSAVGAFPPNGFGLHDIIGNVWEWTADRYDPHAPVDAFDMRTVRGGSWMTAPRGARISERAGLSRIGRHNREVGFRCVR